MPQGPPQGGGGMAGALQAKLAELMQDPVAMQGMQQYMQQMGGGGGGAPPGAPMPPQGAPMPPQMPPEGAPADAEALATDAIDSAGGWEGTEAPTPADIERLENDPSEANIASFNEQFGDGAAEEVLAGGAEADAPAPPDEAEAAEY
jgi:hypothetical protein